MPSSIRSILIAFALVSLLILLVVVPVRAQSWTSAVTTGYTSVGSVFENGTFTWVLTNNTSLAADLETEFDVLVWSLIPFQVQEPLQWSAPEGWIWANDRWQTASGPSRKYYTPDALPPGASVTFTYTPDPDGSLINASGPQPPAPGFIAHVGAVVPGSSSADGATPWEPLSTSHGPTWHDRSTGSSAEAVAEPCGALVLLFGAVCLLIRVSHLFRYLPAK